MGYWASAAVVITALVISGAVYMAFFWPVGSAKKRMAAHHRDMRTTWKVVKLGGPILKNLGMDKKIQYGVIVSTDDMLALTQTMLFCPLINGVDDDTLLAVLPWHVEVKIRDEPERHYARIDYEHKYVSTKIILPIQSNDIDQDGRERGYLDATSQAAVSEKLSAWFPPFSKLAKKPFGSDHGLHL
ncbi:MAG: hypothetical protein P4L57_01845 [Rhizomicrobium sp.]|nr:hypothetical protein [Rhizomicrobium sp.]